MKHVWQPCSDLIDIDLHDRAHPTQSKLPSQRADAGIRKHILRTAAAAQASAPGGHAQMMMNAYPGCSSPARCAWEVVCRVYACSLCRVPGTQRDWPSPS